MRSIILLALNFCALVAANWDTYPQVPQTASINGFADYIYADLPSCAKECVKSSTSNTPCPYWDTGCLCVMPQWSGEVAECFAEKCTSEADAYTASSLAVSLCYRVGAGMWAMPSSVSDEIAAAVGTYSKYFTSTPSMEALETTGASETGNASAEASSTSSGVASTITSGPSSTASHTTTAAATSSKSDSSGVSSGSTLAASTSTSASANSGNYIAEVSTIITVITGGILALFMVV